MPCMCTETLNGMPCMRTETLNRMPCMYTETSRCLLHHRATDTLQFRCSFTHSCIPCQPVLSQHITLGIYTVHPFGVPILTNSLETDFVHHLHGKRLAKIKADRHAAVGLRSTCYTLASNLHNLTDRKQLQCSMS